MKNGRHVGASLVDARLARQTSLMPNEVKRSFGPVRKTERLHFGRVSMPGAKYFVTLVTKERRPWLVEKRSIEFLIQTWSRTHSEGAIRLLAATVMPDHAHAFFELCASLPVGQVIARWKADMRRKLDHAEGFQRDFWEHRLRENEDPEQYALYTFLNPYRAGLISADRSWPGWWAPEPRLFRFSELLDTTGSPPREWMGWPDTVFENLAVGE